jgi:DNA-directed RNA polymerase subunit RPC12/RpoP
MGARSEEREAGYWAVPREIRDRPAKRLGDLILLGQPIAVRCEACGHQRIMDPTELVLRAGYDAELAALEPRMRCRSCGARKVKAKPLERGLS